MPKTVKAILFVVALTLGSQAIAQNTVGDTLRFTVLAGGSVTVPIGQEWRFLGLNYSEGSYSMRTTYEGPDTLTEKTVWTAPFWNVEAQLLGDGKSEGMYELKVVRVR